jgi:hypothetical protein
MDDKGGASMKSWILTCSIDGIDIDYETVIENETEPDYWTCDGIAQENGCDYWTIEEV